MTLKKKILTGYGVAFALMGLVVAWAVANLVLLEKSTDVILRDNYRSIHAADNMINALERQDRGILLMFLNDVQNGIAQFRKNEAIFLEWLARTKDNVTIDGEARLVETIAADYNTYRQHFSSLTDFPDTSKEKLQRSFDIYHQKIDPLFARVRESCVKLRDLNEKNMFAAGITADSVAKRAIWSTVLVAAAALITALIFSLFIVERIVSPIREFTEASRKISSGDYTIKIPMNSGDEIGNLANEFNQMAAKLSHYHELNIEQIISEKNKGEAILNSIEDGLVVFDCNLAVISINPAARRMLFLTAAENTPLKCNDILKNTSVCKLISEIIEGGEYHQIPDEQRIVSLSRAEQFHHYLFSLTAIYGRESRLTGIVLLLRDVTRLKEVERLKNEFILAASHELRTPLTSLGMSIDLLREHVAKDLGDKERELLQAAHEEVHRMKTLVNDLLDLSKIEAGRIAIEFESVPVKTLFDYVQRVFKGQVERKSVSLSGELSADMPNIRADANKITWVLSNLISNALRYVNDGGHIRVVASRIGPQVHISVQDDGPGIPLNYQSKIFQKYVQVKGQESGGTGLGLAICKEIVRAHGGGIWVESLPGQGSTFTFTLPIAH